MQGTATIQAGGDLFRNLHQAEKRLFQVDWADRLLSAEILNGFTWYVPTGLSAIGSGTAVYYSSFLSASATASGAPAASASATASALGSGSAYSHVTISGQDNFATATAYTVSGQVTTDGGRLYIEAFNLYSWNGINFDS